MKWEKKRTFPFLARKPVDLGFAIGAGEHARACARFNKNKGTKRANTRNKKSCDESQAIPYP